MLCNIYYYLNHDLMLMLISYSSLTILIVSAPLPPFVVVRASGALLHVFKVLFTFFDSLHFNFVLPCMLMFASQSKNLVKLHCEVNLSIISCCCL